MARVQRLHFPCQDSLLPILPSKHLSNHDFRIQIHENQAEHRFDIDFYIDFDIDENSTNLFSILSSKSSEIHQLHQFPPHFWAKVLPSRSSRRRWTKRQQVCWVLGKNRANLVVFGCSDSLNSLKSTQQKTKSNESN